MDLKKDISPSTVSRNGVAGSGLSRNSIVLALALAGSSVFKVPIPGSHSRGSKVSGVSADVSGADFISGVHI